ncbi:CynX/NimT family MFS transporter [Paenibacillus lemnae]|uniref:MFS transporter n=1 Tax=Paenibacillus lemnae TaxID=1330551 RepID=A0A848M8T9_PAELE|nr:MFS transporter [Paenibacillus lemnae]NMO96303.1 MFS transporter [Paenibacillus lemnae]
MSARKTTLTQQTRLLPGWLVFASVIFIAINLRAGITSVGPLIGMIREDIGISNTAAGLLTTLPLLAFAVLSPFAAGLARRYSIETVLLISMVILTIGISIRYIASPWTLLFGTALLGAAIAAGNVLLPSLVKRDYPRSIGLMTGTYSMSMNLLAATASGLSIPLAESAGLGWQGSLAVWSLLSMSAAALWVFRRKAYPQPSLDSASISGRRTSAAVLKSRLAWYITLFMGLQSFTFYVNISWLPEILYSQGMDYHDAGWMLSALQFVSLPFSFIIPVLAGRRPDQRVLISVSALCMIFGYMGLLFGFSNFNVLWVILLGISGGANFSLSLMFFSLRTKHADDAAALSGMAQSLGYLLAAAGPMLIGMIHDTTGSWQTPLVTLIIVVVLLFMFGLVAAKPAIMASPQED